MGREVTIPCSNPQNFDDILEITGGFGRWQILMLVILLSFEIPTALIGFHPVFTGRQPEYWACDGNRIAKTEVCGCNGTLSAPEPFTSIVGEWQLVCELSWISDFINSLQMLGMMIGFIQASQFADWYGRKFATIGSCLVLILGSLMSAVAPNHYVYAFARLLCGAGWASVQNLTGTYVIEFLPVTKRAMCACLGPYGWGTMLLGLVAYFVRPWRTLVWICTGVLLALCPLLLFVPESPRFLIRQRNLEEAHDVVNLMAKVNGQPAVGLEILKAVVENEAGSASTGKTEKRSYMDLYSRKELRQRTLCLSGIFFTFGIVYFGIYFNIKNVPGNIYLSVAYIGLSDALGFPSTLLMMERLGRRLSVVISMSLCAVVMVVLAVLQLVLDLVSFPVIIIVSCTLAKYFIAMTRCAAKCFTAESFPTDIRNIGAGFVALFAGLGAAVCPQIVYIGSLSPSVPFFAFAAIAVIGSCFTFFIVETTGKPLEESITGNMVLGAIRTDHHPVENGNEEKDPLP